MANLNKVMLIGRLTRDPEIRAFANGGKVAQIGFAVNNRRKNSATGQWEDEPVFLELEAFNRGETGKTADLVEQYLRKGQQVFFEGHLKFDQWTAQDGSKRSKIKIVVDNMQFLEPRQDGGGGGGPRAPMARTPASVPRQAPAYPPSDYGGDFPSEPSMPSEPVERMDEDNVPF